jgi:hypothetical protein
MDEKEKEKRQTPIVDGDARPDMPLNPDETKAGTSENGKKKFEKERVSDTNSLEDYKDAELDREDTKGGSN